MDVLHFVNSPAGGRSGCFYCEAIINNVVNSIHVSLFTFLNSVTFPPQMEVEFSIKYGLLPYSFFPPDLGSSVPPDGNPHCY